MREKAESGEPVGGANQHHSVTGQAFAIEVGASGCAPEIAAAMHPEHDWFACAGWPFRRPHVEVETVFTAVFKNSAIAGVLGTGRAEGSGRTHASPRFHGLRLTPAQGFDRRLREGDPFKYRAASFEHGALNPAAGYSGFGRILHAPDRSCEQRDRHRHPP